MKFGPQTVQAWLICSLTVVALALILGWYFGKIDIPVGVKDILLVIVGALAGMLTSRGSEIPHDSTVKTDSTTTITTPKEGD